MPFLIRNNKFHTISIKKYYVTLIDPKEMTLRQLLAAYFSISSMKYQNEEEIWKATEAMYDYSFQVKSDFHGKYAVFYFQANAIHPNYIKDKDYTLEKIFELFQDLSDPFIVDNMFDEETFNRAKKQLKATLEKNKKYHEYIATRQAISTYFKGTVRDYEPQGNLNDLKKITKEDLYSYYLKFIKEENGSFTIGDFDSDVDFDPESTLKIHEDLNFRIRNSNVKDTIIKANSKQTYLRLIYDTNVFMGDMDIYPFSILNYVLGGSSYSHLFRIVREKYGLCYCIDSEYYGASGILMVSAEIKKENTESVIKAINEAIDTVVEAIDLEKIKRLLIISNESKYDSQSAYLTEGLRSICFPQAYDEPYYAQRIQNVTLEDIKRVHQKLLIQPFILSYGGNSNE